MNVKTLRIILPLVPMILLAATVAAAFATHGWDVEATLFADDLARKMEDLIAPDVMAGGDAFKVSDVGISDDGRKISLETQVSLAIECACDGKGTFCGYCNRWRFQNRTK